ncbi:MAG: PQQ-binding-like beta-propeller repeat protein [Pirellulaceae bacterium]|nr:PQQ-binding-like beta-propeller repeat protein [Pirellulaceae bacterium]
MQNRTRLDVLAIAGWLFFSPVFLSADDWPMWRYDVGRTANSPLTLAESLPLLWSRQLPAPRPAFAHPRLQFDRCDEPVVLGKRLLVGSSLTDRVAAYDTDSGRLLWDFYAEGPVRLAPVAWRDRVYFGSDDGHLYCLDIADGTLLWKFRAVPSLRKTLGNGRMISLWPVRGGPVLQDGRIYFAAGVWSFEGVFVYALNAEDGRMIWRNDRASFVYGVHPHAATAMGGVTPQGYLLIDGPDLVVPCGTAYPARFDLATGQLKQFELPSPGRFPGGWFAALSTERRRGETSAPAARLAFDRGINTDRHEDDWRVGTGEPELRSRIAAGGQEYRFDLGYANQQAHSMLAADGKLFLVTPDAQLQCFGSGEAGSVHHQRPSVPLDEPGEPWRGRVSRMLRPAEAQHGYALVLGSDSQEIAAELVRQSELQVVVLQTDTESADRLRRRLDAADLYGTRVAVLSGDLAECGLPPYFASLVVATADALPKVELDAEFASAIYRLLRPYGGAAHVFGESHRTAALVRAMEQADLPGVRRELSDDSVAWTRAGGLPGAANYTEPWQESLDDGVKAPLGVLWFNDLVGFFKRSPPPMFVDGVMRAYDKLWTGYPDGDRPPYKLGKAAYLDMYTGRVLADQEIPAADARFPAFDASAKQPSQYRPPTQRDAWNPAAPVAGQRIDPLTGKPQPRAFPKSYGCDGGFDYGWLYTLRSGTAAFYDKREESGTIHISGPRSGCTNSIVPACGLLNVPYYFVGCTCSYPLPSSLSLVNMPPTHEQWSVWGQSDNQPVAGIRRLGINLGAPGDRTSPAGTLWLDHPNVSGPSPVVSIRTEPAEPSLFYQHSLFLDGGRGWPWVGASGAEGLSRLTVEGIAPGRYTVRLTFAEPAPCEAGERVFDVRLQNRVVLEGYDVVRAAGGPLLVVTEQVDDVVLQDELDLRLDARCGKTLLCGLELIAADLFQDELPQKDPATIPQE